MWELGEIGGWLERWVDYLEAVEGKKRSTRRDYLSCVRMLLQDVEIRRPAELTREAIERHAKRRRIAGVGPSKVASMIVATRLFCRYLVAHGQLAENPAAAIATPKAYRTTMRTLSPAEVSLLVFGTKPGTLPRDPEELIAAAMFATMYGAALRPFELGNLLIADVVWSDEEREISVLIRSGKGADRDVRRGLGPSVSRFLGAYLGKRAELGAGAFLFPCLGAHPMSADTVRRRFALLLERRPLEAKGRRLVPKILRASRCTHLLEAGAHVKRVQTFMRHKSVETTLAHYSDIHEDEMGRLLRKHDPFARRRQAPMPLGGAMLKLVEGLGGNSKS